MFCLLEQYSIQLLRCRVTILPPGQGGRVCHPKQLPRLHKILPDTHIDFFLQFFLYAQCPFWSILKRKQAGAELYQAQHSLSQLHISLDLATPYLQMLIQPAVDGA